MKSIKFTFVVLLFLLVNGKMMAQPSDSVNYYRQIPDYPETYSAGTVAARMIDGLGFRFYWATEGLTGQDLNFRPNKEARTSMETIRHIYELSETICHAVKKEIILDEAEENEPRFDEIRKHTLENFKTASDILKTCNDRELEEFKIVFKTKNGDVDYPFWNLLNGPMADVLWHTGQVVSFRRSSGNPINPRVNVFMGKTGK